MSGVRCEHCGGWIGSPSRRVPLWLAVEHHDASCPAVLRVKAKP